MENNFSNDNQAGKGVIDKQKLSQLFKVGTVLLIALTFLIAVMAVNSIKKFIYIGADVEPHSTISVSGEGEVFAIPDTATFSMIVSEEADTPQAAQSAASELMESAIETVKSFGVEEESIKTTSYYSSPRYEYQQFGIPIPPQGQRALVGYEVNHTVEVKVEDSELAGEIVSAIGQLGVQTISNVRMTIGDDSELRNQARQQAIEDAKRKAKQLARDLDVRLVRIISFNESGNFNEFYRYGLGGSPASEVEDGSMSVPLPEGEQSIISNVNITYEIR